MVPYPQRVTLRVYSPSGRTVMSRDLGEVVGWVKVPMDLPDGVYFVRVKGRILKIIVR